MCDVGTTRFDDVAVITRSDVLEYGNLQGKYLRASVLTPCHSPIRTSQQDCALMRFLCSILLDVVRRGVDGGTDGRRSSVVSH